MEISIYNKEVLLSLSNGKTRWKIIVKMNDNELIRMKHCIAQMELLSWPTTGWSQDKMKSPY